MSLTIEAKDGRFARLEAIEWWDQALLARSKVLVVGAGALGNEVIKNLALLGVGHLAIADMDRVELSNLSRSVLFRAADEGRLKAECAGRAAREIFPGMSVHVLSGNILADLGLGWFRWADVVVGALDNREARVFTNSSCARTGRPWFDGGIEVLRGVVRGFAPPRTACYECTMSQVDWDLINKRRSCSLLARRALAHAGVPTTPTSASIIAAMQVQELVKHLHGRPAMLGSGFIYDGETHASAAVNYPLSPDCPWHEPAAEIVAWEEFNSGVPLRVVWAEAERRLGGVDALDFSREIVEALTCPSCRQRELLFAPLENVPEERARCRACGAEAVPNFLHSLGAGSPHLDLSARQLGLPKWDIVWARRGSEVIGFEMSGDRPVRPDAQRVATHSH